MASLPSPASWRRNTSPEQAAQDPTTTSSIAPDTQAEPSAQVILNEPPRNESSSTATAEPKQPDQPTVALSPQVTPPPQDVRTCWICQQESTDDSPGQEWRSPCPCSLTAHDECLMEWITSEEAPKPGDIAMSHQIKCPQCQAPIKIQEPRDIIVLTAGVIQSLAKTLVVPTALGAFVGCFYSGFLVYGVNTMNVVFGTDEAMQIMAVRRSGVGFLTEARLSSGSHFLQKAMKMMEPFVPALDSFRNWKLFIGLPMIAPTLVLARTRVADLIFAVLPITYFLFRPTTHLHIKEWPPSPSLTFAVLPYVRSLYNEIYRHAFLDLEKKWDSAVQRKPREGETQEQVDLERHQIAAGGALFDLEVEIRNELDDGNGPGEGGNDGEWEDVPFVANQAQAQPQDQAAEVNDVAGVAAQPNDDQEPRRRPREARRNWSSGSILGTTMGALFFPAISAAMGDILKHSLPPRLVGRAVGSKGSRGLLSEKWGRTVVGGCLFVVLKDAITLYCKWKKARDFGKKKVLDYVGKRGSDGGQAAAQTQAPMALGGNEHSAPP